MPKKLTRSRRIIQGFFLSGSATRGKGGKGLLHRVQAGRQGIEEKVGRQYQDDMTPARAARVRAERIEGQAAIPERDSRSGRGYKMDG